jgi:tetratricopeptide (TPR) repeat protein
MNIILVLQFVSVGAAITSDRYSYVPYIGLFFVIAMGFHKLYTSKEKRFAVYKTVSAAALIIFSLTMVVATQARCKVWKNNEVMWTDVIEKYPNSFMAYDNRGTYYRSIKNNDKALLDYINTIKYNPKYALGYNNRGDIYFDLGKDSLALIDYNQALAIDPKLVNSYTNRAIVYCRKQQYDKAFQEFDRAYQVDSTFDKLYYNRGILYDVLNKEDLAIADFRKYLKTNPYDDGIMNSIGVALQKDKKLAESIVEFDKAIELKPNEPSYYMNKSISEHFLNQDDKARADALTSKKLGGAINPNYAKALGIE